jgi:hypothetical protein
LSKVLSAPRQRHFQVNNTARRPKITVSADGQGILSQAGALLLAETLRVTGLGEGLSAGWPGGGRRGRCMIPGRSSLTWP